MANKVNHPKHYGGDTVYEAIKVITAWRLGFNLGNTVKYICRAGKKDMGPFHGGVSEGKIKKTLSKIQDLRKAEFYLRYEIELQELYLMRLKKLK